MMSVLGTTFVIIYLHPRDHCSVSRRISSRSMCQLWRVFQVGKSLNKDNAASWDVSPKTITAPKTNVIYNLLTIESLKFTKSIDDIGFMI
jgi:hypothetical protein